MREAGGKSVGWRFSAEFTLGRVTSSRGPEKPDPYEIVEQTPGTHVNLLLNYSEELRRRMASEDK
jgi:hypothetical protein